MKTINPLFIAVLSSFSIAAAQIPSDREGLLNGEGMGQATYAELSGYPGPKHVLEFSDTLKLSPEQQREVKKFFDEVQMKGKELGKKIVELEEQFIDKFRSGIRSEKKVKTLSERIGKLRGQLRALHLVAHMKTERVLTPEQISLYKKLRGLHEALPQHGH